MADYRSPDAGLPVLRYAAIPAPCGRGVLRQRSRCVLPPVSRGRRIARRVLVYLYESDPGQRDERASADDEATLARLYERAVAVQTDAWMLRASRTLPPWWRLVHAVRAEGGPERVTWPMSEAAMRLAGMDTAEQPYERDGWRIAQRGPRAGQNVRVVERQVTGRLVRVAPDRRIWHPEAFTPAREGARIEGCTPDEIRIIIP